MQEIWKPVGGTDRYEVNNYGVIRGNGIVDDCVVVDSTPGRVMLYDRNGCITERSRELIVAHAFLNRPTGKFQLHHINGDNLDCRVDNLEWFSTCRRNKRVGQYSAKGEFIREFDSARTASEYTGISYQGICSCCNNQQSKAGGFRWAYFDDTRSTVQVTVLGCPCCNGKSRLSSTPSGKSFVQCENCGLRTDDMNSPMEAVICWNKRV